ncbi:hypothetical protein JB92DRAFT_1442007 [Gautieria morchelliformis]|nr:hypothetical protein JB92DRAFT_1442007 [Gautieria morchelliformis]
MQNCQTSVLRSNVAAALELSRRIQQQLSTFPDGHATDDTDPSLALRKGQAGQHENTQARPAEDTHTPRLTRSEKLYMEDGNIVIAAEAVAFRVHKGLLTRHSGVFSGMFGLGSLPSDAET